MRLLAAVGFSLVLVACGSDNITSQPTDDSDTEEAVTPMATGDAAATEQPAPTTAASPTVSATGEDPAFPTIIDATATIGSDGSWSFAVTVSSPYDSPEQYADAWRVLGPDGTEYGVRVLTHDHASEQPFTRSTSGIQIPIDVRTVLIEGHDLLNGWSGQQFEVELGR